MSGTWVAVSSTLKSELLKTVRVLMARKVFKAGYRGNPKLKPGSRGGWYDFLDVERPPREKKK